MENCQGFFQSGEAKVASCLDAFQASGSWQWFFGNLLEAAYNIPYAIMYASDWLLWVSETGQRLTSVDAKQALMRFVYYGGSVEFFFAVFVFVLILTGIGFARNGFMWGMVRGLEGLANGVGRVATWAALLMVLQQIVIVFMQRIFTASEISFAFLPYDWATYDVSWWSEELKLYNALLVTLCVSYTFVQGGHVRVDLVYSAVGYRTKRVIDMIGSVIFMAPAAVLTWMFGWYFMWRHMIVPNPSATDGLDKLLLKSRAARWNVETIGFSPNGFNAYFLFKLLLLAFAALVFLQSVAFFYRSYLEWKEGPDSEGKFLNKDRLGDDTAEVAADIH